MTLNERKYRQKLKTTGWAQRHISPSLIWCDFTLQKTEGILQTSYPQVRRYKNNGLMIAEVKSDTQRLRINVLKTPLWNKTAIFGMLRCLSLKTVISHVVLTAVFAAQTFSVAEFDFSSRLLSHVSYTIRYHRRRMRTYRAIRMKWMCVNALKLRSYLIVFDLTITTIVNRFPATPSTMSIKRIEADTTIAAWLKAATARPIGQAGHCPTILWHLIFT